MNCFFRRTIPLCRLNSFLLIYSLLNLICLVTPFAGIAQSPARKEGRFELGLIAGASLNRFSKSQPHTGYHTGFTAGVSGNYSVYKNLSLQLEANFLQQGGQALLFKDDTRLGLPESFDTKHTVNSAYTLNSLEVPLLIQYTFNIRQSWFPSLYAGGSYAYNIQAKEKYQKTGSLLPGEDVIATVTAQRTVTGAFTTSRANFIAGALVKLPVGEQLRLLIDFRYLHGLNAARSHYSYMDKPGFGSDIRTNSLVTRLGFLLPL